MGDFLPDLIVSGDPIAKVPAKFYTDVDEVLTFLEVYNGYIEKTENFWRIVFAGDDPSENLIKGPKGLYHFKVTMSDATNIKVLGGSRIRDAVGDMLRVPMTGDGGDSPTVDQFATVAVAASVYVYAELDDALAPTTLTINTNAAYPDPDNDSLKLVLGFVTFAGGAITGIEQYWTGGDWRDQYEEEDAASLGFNAANLSEVFGFGAAVSESITDTANDLILFKDAGDSKMAYTSLAAFGESLATLWTGTPPANVPWPLTWDELDDTVGDPTNVLNAGFIPIVTDQGAGVYRLELIDGSATGPWWKLGNVAAAHAYGAVIGDSAQAVVIDLDNKQLENGAGASVYDWALRQFDGTEQTFLNGTKIIGADVTGITPGTVASGSAQLAGGLTGNEFIQSRGYYLLDAITNTWQAGSFNVDVGGNAVLSGTGLAVVDGDGGVVVDTGVGLTTNGDTGQDITNWLTNGFVTGANVVEVDFGDLQLGDKVLAIV